MRLSEPPVLAQAFLRHSAARAARHSSDDCSRSGDSKTAAAGMSRMRRRLVPGSRQPDVHWRMAAMAHVRRFDDVGITVDDLDVVTAFFVGLGLEVE